jgi:hypothetical protein
MAEYVDYNGKRYVVSESGDVYQSSGRDVTLVVNDQLRKIILQIFQQTKRNAATLREGQALGAVFATVAPPPVQPSRGSGGSGVGSSAPSKADSTGATLPANSEIIDIRVSDEILEELNRLTLDLIDDSQDLIPFNLSFRSIDFIPEREVFSADNEEQYGIYFEDLELDPLVNVRNMESETIALDKISTRLRNLQEARLQGKKGYYNAFTVNYDSNGTPIITLNIDTGPTGIDGLNVIILEIKDKTESFTRQIPPS